MVGDMVDDWREHGGSRGMPDFEPPGAPSEPDYSSFSDEDLEEAAQAHPDQAGLRQDILPDDYQPDTFGSRFRDAYQANQQALAAGERNASNGYTPPEHWFGGAWVWLGP